MLTLLPGLGDQRAQAIVLDRITQSFGTGKRESLRERLGSLFKSGSHPQKKEQTS